MNGGTIYIGVQDNEEIVVLKMLTLFGTGLSLETAMLEASQPKLNVKFE